MQNDRLDGTVQQLLLALLCCDKLYGAQVGLQLQNKHFDGVRRDIATAVLRYRSKYKGEPPGKRNLPALIENLPLHEERLETARHEAREILRLDKKGFNKDYVVGLGLKFAKLQEFKEGILEATELVGKANAESVEEIEQILHRTLRNQPNVITPGTRLSDPDALDFLNKHEEGYAFGITTLDKAGLLLSPGTSTLYMGAKNTGKSWFCVHVGRTCILQGARVLHISLEMAKHQVLKRYFQNWFALPTNLTKEFERAVIKKDNKGRAISWDVKRFTSELSLADDDIRDRLSSRIKKWSTRGFDRLMVADFPSGSLTMSQLENYLDALVTADEFTPDVVIIDYPDLMKINRSNYRLDLGEIYVMLRGLAVKRHLAMVTPTQINREGYGKKKVNSSNVGEDISKIFTADTVLTYSQTSSERDIGLARLTLEHARDIAVGSEILLVQHYATGQYVCGEALVSPEYMKRIGKRDADANGEEPTGEGGLV